MLDHVSTYATDFDATRRIYTAALAPLGSRVQMELVTASDPDFPTRRLCAFGPTRPVFRGVEARQAATPRHAAFAAADRAAVAAFHRAALAAGARDNGAPGLRPQYHPHHLGAFVLDPDGNDVEAVCHTPEG
jgi:catechol 2,3-dioxygenase-like lactoylglutathione lyase family enzyme